MKKIFLTMMLSIMAASVMAQDKPWCGAHDIMNEKRTSDATFDGNLNLLGNDDNINHNASARNIIIPVVIHIVYKDSSEIPSMEELEVQMKGLNDDFNARNWDLEFVPDMFKSLIADTKISFKLATVGPGKKRTTGITYTKTSQEEFSIYDDGVKSSLMGGKDAWDTRKYLNLWICDLGDWLRGYAQFPGDEPLTDGVVVDYTDIGTYKEVVTVQGFGMPDSSIVIPYRVLTHEVGHWLGLFHIWGDSYCGDDKIKDTPAQEGPHWNCGGGDTLKSCGSIDMICNQMDYIGMECMLMFTNNQKKRMWKTLTMFRKEMLTRRNHKLIKD